MNHSKAERQRIPRPLHEIITEVCARYFENEGFFVEAGAHDGVSHSNTLHLEQKGWTGLLVEPSPVAFQEVLKNRPNSISVQCALVATADQVEVIGTFADGSLMGSAHPQIKRRDQARSRNLFDKVINHLTDRLGLPPRIREIGVPARTLDSLMDEHGIKSIDLLVLDVEGFERDVLHGFSFHPRPKLVVIETRSPDCQEIAELMLANGYFLAANVSNFSKVWNPLYTGDHQDFAWIAKEELELLKIMSETKLWKSDPRG